MKWTIVKKSKIQDMESVIECLEKENKQLFNKAQSLEREVEKYKDRERKSENGEVVCGTYCDVCEHAYKKSFNSFIPEYGCKLLAKKECAHFEVK